MIRVGRVVDNKDGTAAGLIKVVPLDSENEPEPIVCAACGPGLGVEKGFLSIPDVGQAVLFAELKAQSYELAVGTDKHQFNYVWFGCIGESMHDEKNRTPFAADKHYPENYDSSQAKPRVPVRLAAGIPDPERVYAGNNIPEVDIWKHKNGHKIIMAHKVAEDGTNDDTILLKARSGKIIQIDDHIGTKQNDGGSPPPGDRITLKDEHGNRLELMTSYDKFELETIRDQEYISTQGHQEMKLMHASKGHQRRDNLGKGDMYDTVHQGQYKLVAAKDISDISRRGDILYQAKQGDIKVQAEKGRIDVLADDNEIVVDAKTKITLVCGGSTIVMTPDSITITAGTVNINGTTNVTGTTSIVGATSVVGLTSITGATSIAGGLGVTGGPSVFNGTTFETHTHSGVDTGTGNSGPPNP